MLILSWSDIKHSTEFIAGLDIVVANSIDECDVILAHGTEYVLGAEMGPTAKFASDLSQCDVLEAILTAGIAKGLPMVCANADHVAVIAGKMKTCPGWIADRCN